MAKKETAVVYDFEHLRRRIENYAGFSFETVSTLVHNHLDFYEMILITSGEFQHTFNNQTNTFSAGTLLLFKPGVTHQLFTEPFTSTHFVMCIAKDYFEKRAKDMFPKYNLDSFHGFTSIPIGKHELRYMEHLGTELCQRTAPNLNSAEELLYLCLSAIASHNDALNLDTYVADIIRKLNNQLYMNTSAKDIYAHYPCSETVLLRHFKERTGMTITEYRTHTKMHYACQLLTETDTKIIDIAAALQYDSLSYFLRTFKTHTGVTPTQYRRQHIHSEKKL